MNEKSRETLLKAGWYEGKKIDLTNIIAIYKRENIELSQKQKEYMEEFGDLTIRNNRNQPYHKFNINDLFKKNYRECLSIALSKVLKENLITVGTISGCMNTLYISESGKFYDDFGYLGDDKYAIWNLVFQNDSSEFDEKFVLYQTLGLYDQISEEIAKEMEEDI